MKIQFLGAAKEVGRSCIVIDGKYMLDCGLKISSEGQEYPIVPKNINNIKAVFLSHGHLDHCGSLPFFNFKGLNCKVYCTRMTKKIASIIMKDSLHIDMLSNKDQCYEYGNIKNILSDIVEVNYNKPFNVEDSVVEFLDAGHIPGSSSIMLQTKNKKLIYTGDINSVDTNLMKGLVYNPGNVDILITETTYGDREHDPRDETEKEFLDAVEEIIKYGGKVLVPAFSIGRAQEILLMLNKRRIKVPIYLDGMAKKVAKLILQEPYTVKNAEKLRACMKNVRVINAESQRNEAIKEQCIVVTTSGMVVGGPVLSYLKHVYHDKNSGILLTGYQAEGTNGRMLLENQKVVIDGIMLNVKCHIQKFDFSAHIGRKELVEFIRKINPKHLILNHGDQHAMESVKNEFAKKMRA